jgi:hypothetical protein
MSIASPTAVTAVVSHPAQKPQNGARVQRR